MTLICYLGIATTITSISCEICVDCGLSWTWSGLCCFYTIISTQKLFIFLPNVVICCRCCNTVVTFLQLFCCKTPQNCLYLSLCWLVGWSASDSQVSAFICIRVSYENANYFLTYTYILIHVPAYTYIYGKSCVAYFVELWKLQSIYLLIVLFEFENFGKLLQNCVY